MPDRADQSPQQLADGFAGASHAQWRALVDKVLKGGDFRKRLVRRTADGIDVEPLYTRNSATGMSGALARVRQERAITPGWRVAQVRAEPTPERLVRALADDIEGGADAVTLRLAAPGQCGLPAERSALEAVMFQVLSSRLRLSLQPGTHGLEAAGILRAIAEQRGAEFTIAGLGIDPLGTLARTGDGALLKPDGTGFARPLPWLAGGGTTLIADGRPYHEAGGSPAQEIAALAATLVAYLRACEADGVGPGEALPRISLAMAGDADLFATIAKLRAGRLVVARIGAACGAGAAAASLALHVTTSERMLARRDPWVNLLRTTAACAAAALGGADEIAVLPHTWALGVPDAFASRIARNTGLVLREEAGLGRICDPAGGAWYVESLTAAIADKAWTIFREWEAEGGMQAALVSGLVQDRIATVADQQAKDVASRRMELTGVSAFPQLGDDGVTAEPWPTPVPVPAVAVARPLQPVRLAEPFERLRDAADRSARRPSVFVASLGTLADHQGRSMWVANLLAAGGIEALGSGDLTSSVEVGRTFAESGARVACLCSSDAVYGEIGEASAMALKAAGAAKVYLAGRPGRLEGGLQAAGVDGFLAAGDDAVAVLSRLQAEVAA